MKMGIYQVDGTMYQGVQFPNIALMKIAGYHKSIGDTVEWYEGILFANQFDKIYASKIFEFSKMPQIPDNMVIGGTGIDFHNKLPVEIENATMDWEIYPNTPFHYGFSMKGCRFKCAFCCVPTKEGKPKNYNTIDELITNPSGGKNLMLLDNDFFGGTNWKENLERIIELKLKVCFVQGLNIRIISEKQAELLAKCNYRNSKFNKKYLTFAWDKFEDEKVIIRGIERCNKYGIPCKNMQFFLLIGFDSTPEQDAYRVEFLRKLGCKPFVMPYNKSDKYQKAYTRYVNNRIIFNSCTWEDYKYYKIENKACEVYQKLHELRTKELQMDKENLELIKNTVVIQFLSYLGHDQQTMSRTIRYTGFQFLHFRQISFKIWAEHKEEKSFYVPNLKTKEGRKMNDFLNNMQKSDFRDVFNILNLELSMDKFRVAYLEICGDNLVLMLGNEYQPKDENIIEITSKEFNKIREAHIIQKHNENNTN